MEPIKEAAGNIPHAASLPVYLTRFVGREDELATLTSLLTGQRLLTLVGAGGVGKTRLALQVATQLSDSFDDGMYLIELAPFSDPQLVPQAIASALNMRTDRDSSLIALLKSELAERNVLLLLDNCEQVVSECAVLVEALLRACPRLHILATSREPLRVAGEVTWRVTPLSIPDPNQHLAIEKLMCYEAVQLFYERAVESNPRFLLTSQNAAPVARICAHLDGLPLALELAAALLPIYSVDQLAARVDERFKLLRYGKRTAEARHHSLEAALDWSFALLTPNEQALFLRLAVFAGSWNVEAMQHVCASDDLAPPLIAETLVYLVNKSLIVAEEQEGAEENTVEVRYRLLDTMRQYALEKLRQGDDFQQMMEQHYAWHLHLAEEANAHISGAEQAQWLQRLEMETPNLRAALSRALADRRLDAAVRLADALRRFWIIHNYFSEGRYWFDALLAADNQEVNRHKGTAGDHWRIEDRRQALSLQSVLRARALFGAAEFARYQGAYDRTCALLIEEIALLEKLEDRPALAEAQVYLGLTMGLQGKYEQGMALCKTGLSFYRGLGDQQGTGIALATLAFITLAQGDAQEAMALSEEACQLLRETGNHVHLLYALFTQAQAALFLKAIKQARVACRKALRLAQAQRQSYGIAASLGLIAGIAGTEERYAQAARLFGAAQALQERIQAPHPPAGRALLERMVFSIIAAFGQEKFLLHFAEGKSSSLQDILLEAEAILETPPASHTVGPSTAAAEVAGLSPRELEVLALVAKGLTDAQVARYLFLSTRTVSKHLQSIYARLGVNSRSAATRFAFEHGLV